MNVLRKQKQAVGTGIQQPVFVWSVPDRLSLAADLYTRRRCRCLPLHGVLLVASLYFSDCSQKHIFPWRYFRILGRAGKDIVSLGGYCSSPCVWCMMTFRFLERLFVKLMQFATDLLQTAVFRLASVTCFLYSHWPNFQLLYSPLAKKVSNVLCGLMIVFSVDAWYTEF